MPMPINVLRQIAPQQHFKPARMKMQVLHPAQMPPPGVGAPIPDPHHEYAGTAIDHSPGLIILGQAQIVGGQRVGTNIVGCTYTTQTYTIPGFCLIAVER